MSWKAQRSSLHTPAAIIVGIAVFVAGLVASLSRGTGPGVHAQPDCVQPAESGCPLGLNNIVQASLTDATSTHNWLLEVPTGDDFILTLTSVPGDYDLTVYGPDSSLRGVAEGVGASDKMIQVGNIGVGTYWVTVSSPRGDASATPYTLIAASMVTIPFTTYGAPPTSPFTPY